MSSEQLADGVNPLDAELAATWDVLKGYSGRDTDLGIARRFGGAASAYSLRDIGAMNGRVVKVRRDVDGQGSDPEEDFSANQVQDGTLEKWVNGELESTLPADVATAAAAYSLRKVKADYGIPTTVVNGTENFPATIPSSGSPADIGNGFTVHKFSDGIADSESVTVSGGTITVTAIASGTGTFSGGCRIKGLSDNKQYTVSGEFRVTSQGADGDGVALVDISDNTAGTDEDSITTSSTTFTPFFIDAGYNGGSSNNFVDLQANSNGSNSGTLTAEFRNVQIIENNNSAVRIRRSSDDEEVVVGFDSDDKVSASSPVTATPSGSTTATDLNGFLNEKLTLGTAINGTAAFDNYTLTNVSDTGFSADNTAGGTGSAGFPYKHATGDVIVVRFTVSNFNSTSSLSPVLRGTINTGSVVGTTTGGSELTANGTYTETHTATADGTLLMFADGNTGSYTISDFEIVSHTHQAFVHTWYDQAGSNNAVQTTATNQPKIAESGALLADGIDFDGTDDYLEADALSSIYTGTDTVSSAFVVVDSDVASTTQYILGIGSSTSGNPLRNTLFHSGGNIGWQVRDDVGLLKTDLSANPYVANQTYLVSALNSGTTIDFNTNSVINDNGTDADVGASTIDTVHIGTRANSPTGYLNGSIQELVFYATDQSDNRFKIESNINNYYGLYNDELELNGEAKPASSVIIGGVTYSSGTLVTLPNKNSLEYTLNDQETGNRFMRYMVNPNGNLTNLSNGDVVYVSFNLNAPDGLTIIAQLRDNFTGVSSTASFSRSGFKKFALTRNSTSGTVDNIMFQSSGVANATISMTDIKVSRIARNGFVETWYDQSVNGRDMLQDAANEQPIIVENGGLVKDPSSGFPSVKFQQQPDGTGGRNLQLAGNIPLASDNALTHFVVASIDRDDIQNTRLTGAAVDLFLSSGEKLSIRFGNNFTAYPLPTLGLNSTTLLGAVVTTGLIPTLHFNDNTSTSSALNGTGTPTVVQILGENTEGGDNLNRYHLSGTMSECILYLNDQGTDIDEIKSDINNFYNIYS